MHHLPHDKKAVAPRFLLLQILFLLIASFQPNAAVAQKEKVENQDKAIKTVINRFFEGLNKGDTVLLRSTCTETPVFQTFMADKEGKWRVFTEDFNEFVAFVGSPSDKKYEEKIEFGHIEAEQSLASVWTPYRFLVNGKVSHTGTNSFQLVKTPDGWKIQYIIDTRRKGK